MSTTFLPSPVAYENLQDNCILAQLLPLDRDPTASDMYNVGTFALNSTARTVWMCTAYSSGAPVWTELT